MSTMYEIILLAVVLVAVVGQFAVITWCRRRTFFDPKHSAKARADLIEREFNKINGDPK